MRFNAADMLFCLLLYMSVLISSMDKHLERSPLKATPANQDRWEARDEEQNDADLKMSAGVAFLIVYSHCSGRWCAWSHSRLFAYLNSAFLSIVVSYISVGIRLKLKRLKKPCDFSLKGWKLIMRKQTEPRPPTPFIRGAMRLIILLEGLQVRAPQPALCNRHSNKSRRTRRWRWMAHYALLLLSCLLVSKRASKMTRMKWEEATADSHYELVWLMVVMQGAASQILLFQRFCPWRSWLWCTVSQFHGNILLTRKNVLYITIIFLFRCFLFVAGG